MTSNYASISNWNQRVRKITPTVPLQISFDPITKVLTINDGTGDQTIYSPSGIVPGAHHVSHELGGTDIVTPTVHHTRHENGGADEITVLGLSGLLADSQTALAHKVSHQLAGSDALSVAGLSGLLATAQTPVAHHVNHETGGSDTVTVTQAQITGKTLSSFDPLNADGRFVKQQFGGVEAIVYYDHLGAAVLVASTKTFSVYSGSGGIQQFAVDYINHLTQLSQPLYPTDSAGNAQGNSALRQGFGIPNNANGNNGDYYLRGDPLGVLTHLYFKAGGAWAGLL